MMRIILIFAYRWEENNQRASASAECLLVVIFWPQNTFLVVWITFILFSLSDHVHGTTAPNELGAKF